MNSTNLPCLTSVWPGNISDSRNSSLYNKTKGSAKGYKCSVFSNEYYSHRMEYVENTILMTAER